MTLETFEARLRAALAGPRPGLAAQARMQPRPPRSAEHGMLAPGQGRNGAALILFYPRDGEAHLLLTVRARHLSSHRGQVSFPGGGAEGDESAVACALREAWEEAGVDPAAVRVVGTLTPLHVAVSRYVVEPVVAVTDRHPDLRATESEVERILEVPVAHLLDAERVKIEARVLRGEPRLIPYFDLEAEKVWGATAMILSELLTMLGVGPDPWRELSAP